MPFALTILTSVVLVFDFASARPGAPIEATSLGNGGRETCEYPWHSESFYSEDDRDEEKDLCGIDFYDSANYEIKAKTNSTNPGVLVYSRSSGKKIAKYKQSISCSYTPSIIGYYHLSQLLGTKNVPHSVYRTMDSREHDRIVDEGVAGTSGLINQLWRQYRSWKRRANNGQASTKIKRLYHDLDPSTQLMAGALSVNPRGEEKYTEIMGLRGGNSGTYKRIKNFLSSSIFAPVKSSRSMVSQFGSDFSTLAPKLQLYSDLTGMLVMDYLMAQQDRYGNQHYYDYYLVKTSEGDFKKLKQSKWERSGNTFTKTSSGKVVVAEEYASSKVLLLKDNDCGVIKTNHAAEVGAHKHIRHLNYKLYQKLLHFNQNIKITGGEYALIFYSSSKFTQSDLDGLRSRSSQLTDYLQNACRSGRLKLDLSIKDYLAGIERTTADCEYQPELFN